MSDNVQKAIEAACMEIGSPAEPADMRLARAAIIAYLRESMEPTDAQYKASLEFGLEHMKAHGVDSLSPFKDYPPLRSTTEGMFKAMRQAEIQGLEGEE